ncbi:MAG: septum formation initiator family protein [Gammaproteobacteria bacterium]|nr:septum formation initiator family protein [Gammaproteobacteria bacterium]
MTFHRTRVLQLVLILVLLFIQYHLWFESSGIIDMLRTKKQLALQLQLNDKLKQRNAKLISQVQYLQTHNEAVESRARGELGMIKKDETYYQIVKN